MTFIDIFFSMFVTCLWRKTTKWWENGVKENECRCYLYDRNSHMMWPKKFMSSIIRYEMITIELLFSCHATLYKNKVIVKWIQWNSWTVRIWIYRYIVKDLKLSSKCASRKLEHLYVHYQRVVGNWSAVSFRILLNYGKKGNFLHRECKWRT